MARIGPVPVLCGSLWDSRAEALASPTADLELAGCGACGHVWNWRFDARLVEYDAQYDNALDFSPTFRAYAESLADRLVDAFDLRGKRIAEIGSGKGEFLRRLCTAGDNSGVGYDPTYEGPDRDGDIDFVREFFTPATSPGRTDFVCCRHVLEHIEDPYAFLLDVRAAVEEEPVPMYFEVPNAEFNFSESGPWDLIYPHVAYFSPSSLRALFVRSGFSVQRLEPSFNGQFLSAEVTPAPGVPDLGQRASNGLAEAPQAALARQLSETQRWRQRLDELSGEGEVAVWGAGSKGVTFLSLADAGRTISTVIDANPRKWGRFLPSCGHEVVSPDEVSARSVKSVVVMNPAYAEEIRGSIAALGSQAEVLVV